MKEHAIVVGAGLVGSLQALLLAKRGFKVDVYEGRGDIREMDFIGGRSINLALSNRGWKALDLAGIGNEIRDISIPMHSRLMHSVDGELTYQAYGKEGEAIYSVSRGELNRQMVLKASEFEDVNFHFNHKCLDLDLDTNTLTFLDRAAGKEVKVEAGQIYGTDGAFSSVRKRMQRMDRFNYSQDYMKHGYKELVIPPNHDGSHRIDKNALHIWPRGQYMLIALANQDGSFTVTLFFPFEGPVSFESLDTDEKIMAFFEAEFPDTIPLMPNLIQDYHDNPSASLCIIRCEPWNYKDKVLLMGDSAHAIVPFYGQGMNSGFEDCSEWWRLTEELGEDWSKVFPEFSKVRKPNGDAIAQLALNNYIEMRDLVGDPMFLLRKKIEKKMFTKHPETWMPLYSMVTFSHTPYSEALALGKKQEKIMDSIMSLQNIEEIWDSEQIEQQILAQL